MARLVGAEREKAQDTAIFGPIVAQYLLWKHLVSKADNVMIFGAWHRLVGAIGAGFRATAYINGLGGLFWRPIRGRRDGSTPPQSALSPTVNEH